MSHQLHESQIRLPTPEFPVVLYSSEGTIQPDKNLPGTAVLPGSFNPLHVGHRALKTAAEKKLNTEVILELSISNVEKEQISTQDVCSRLNHILLSNFRAVVTNASLFHEKASLFPESTFVVGFDTALRILDPFFYDDESTMHSILETLCESGYRFIVGGRVVGKANRAEFLCIEQLNMADRYKKLFCGLTESEFREDISSTALRAESTTNE